MAFIDNIMVSLIQHGKLKHCNFTPLFLRCLNEQDTQKGRKHIFTLHNCHAFYFFHFLCNTAWYYKV